MSNVVESSLAKFAKQFVIDHVSKSKEECLKAINEAGLIPELLRFDVAGCNSIYRIQKPNETMTIRFMDSIFVESRGVLLNVEYDHD